MQQYLGRTYEDIIEEYSSVPVDVKHASLMLVDAANSTLRLAVYAAGQINTLIV